MGTFSKAMRASGRVACAFATLLVVVSGVSERSAPPPAIEAEKSISGQLVEVGVKATAAEAGPCASCGVACAPVIPASTEAPTLDLADKLFGLVSLNRKGKAPEKETESERTSSGSADSQLPCSAEVGTKKKKDRKRAIPEPVKCSSAVGEGALCAGQQIEVDPTKLVTGSEDNKVPLERDPDSSDALAPAN